MRKIYHKTKHRSSEKKKRKLRCIRKKNLWEKAIRESTMGSLFGPNNNGETPKVRKDKDNPLDIKKESKICAYILYALIINCSSELADPRKGKNKSYELQTFYIVAFILLFYCNSSINNFYRHLDSIELDDFLKMDWLLRYLDIDNIPKESQLRDILDRCRINIIKNLFSEIILKMIEDGTLEKYVCEGNILRIAFDATQYFNSKKLSCQNCSTKNHDKDNPNSTDLEFHHNVLVAAIIPPDNSSLKPIILTPEEIIPQDGSEKQDCEINAAKRLIINNLKFLESLGYELVILGDDIYSHQPFCKLLDDNNFKFIHSCLPITHKAIKEFTYGIKPLVYKYQNQIKNKTFRHIVKVWHNVPIKFEDNKTTYQHSINKKNKEIIKNVTYVYHEKTIVSNYNRVLRGNKGNTIKSTMSYATNYEIDNIDKAKKVISSGRSRWIIENKVFNVIKNHGYKLEHNYGHGKNNLSINFMLLTLLVFNTHALMDIEKGDIYGTDYKYDEKDRYETFTYLINIIKDKLITKSFLKKIKYKLLFFIDINITPK